MIVISKSQKQALGIATVIALSFGAYFLRHYAMMIVFASIVAFMFNPVYKRFEKRFKHRSSAASATFLVTLIAFIIPVSIVLIITIYQISHLVDVVANIYTNTNLNQLLTSWIDKANNILQSLGVSYRLSLSGIEAALTDTFKNFAGTLASSITGYISGVAEFFTVAIIYIYVFMSLLVNQDKIIQLAHQMNPLGEKISKLYLDRTAAMTKAMARGQFIIAALQGATDAALLYIAGLHSLFFFFFLLLTALSIIPLGGGIVAIPIGIVMIITGHVWEGLVVVLGHIIIVTSEDNILRPKLVPREARLDPGLTILSVFSGLKMFGFLGIVIGPVLMILIVTTIQVFLEVFKQVKSVDASEGSKNPQNKLMFWKRF